MAPTKVLNCSHGQALSFAYSRRVQLAEGRALRELTPSGSVKKSSFFKKHFVIYLAIILFYTVALPPQFTARSTLCGDGTTGAWPRSFILTLSVRISGM